MSSLVVFFDADALLAGSASTTGAAHLLLCLSELGVIKGVTSVQATEEARRNLVKKIPDAVFELDQIIARAVTVHPNSDDLTAFEGFAHPKDVAILAAAVATGARWLVTFNCKYFYNPAQIVVLNPGQAIRSIRETLGDVGNTLQGEDLS